jgi:hypothetical protein
LSLFFRFGAHGAKCPGAVVMSFSVALAISNAGNIYCTVQFIIKVFHDSMHSRRAAEDPAWAPWLVGSGLACATGSLRPGSRMGGQGRAGAARARDSAGCKAMLRPWTGPPSNGGSAMAMHSSIS